ncbi:MAG: potassium channel family protein [Thermodesulfobacteriota bacterium]
MFFPVISGGIFLSLVFIFGLYIFVFVEGWGWLDSFYQVVITLSTVGFTEVRPLSETGRMLTSILILLGVGSFAYLVGSFTQVIVEGHLRNFIGRRRVQKIIGSLEDHFIICGFGRIGSVVAGEIKKEGFSVVVVENNPEIIQQLESEGHLFIEGDATSDQVLLSANLMNARALITTLNQESKNVYVTLTARQLSPEITLIARAEREDSIKKLKFAGADRVLTPHIIGGMRMAQIVLRPTVTDFLELAMQGKNLDLLMEELEITPGSFLVGKDLIQSDIRPKYNLIIIAIKNKDGDMNFNPQPRTVLDSGDTLIAVGKQDNLERLREIL